MRFDLDALPQFDTAAPEPTADGKPLQLPVADIDEDPLQPRQEFEAEALQELAASIAQRGLLQAISVRQHPDQAHRWLLNFGARRLRAFRALGLTHIPATVNELSTSYDQVIENEQREGLKPLELALFVQQRMSLGESQADIARQLGKSAPYVTYATALIDAPDWLMKLYREGRCRGMRELHQLRQLHKLHPDPLQDFVAGGGHITRDVVAALKTSLSQAGSVATSSRSVEPGHAKDQATAQTTSALLRLKERPLKTPARDESKAPVMSAKPATNPLTLLAELDGETVEIIVDEAPIEVGKIFVRKTGVELRLTVDTASLRLLRIVGRDIHSSR